MKANGGQAFPCAETQYSESTAGMTLRDYFACHVQPREETDAISSCDDQDLLMNYGTTEEMEEGFRFVIPEQPMYLSNIVLRSKLEARARAHLRYLEADAMLAERDKE